MKKILILSILTIYMISFVLAVPKIEPYVNDFADLLTDEEEINLNLLIDQIEINTTWEIAIVTTQNTEGIDRVSYANMIGDENGVGKKDKDNGIVVLWSLENEDGGAIATGRYSESIINDAKAGRIGRESREYFDNKEYYNGFEFIVKELEKEIKGEKNESEIEQSENLDGDFGIGGFILFGLILLVFIIIIYIVTKEDEEDSYSHGVFVGSGSNRSSSGGVSFSGGSFGGGGAGF